jgi:hypothetical protein
MSSLKARAKALAIEPDVDPREQKIAARNPFGRRAFGGSNQGMQLTAPVHREPGSKHRGGHQPKKPRNVKGGR